MRTRPQLDQSSTDVCASSFLSEALQLAVLNGKSPRVEPTLITAAVFSRPSCVHRAPHRLAVLTRMASEAKRWVSATQVDW